MKVSNWCRKLMASIIAGGALAPAAAYAIDIPLGDPSFEAYLVPADPGYAYAAPPAGSYRPTSPWVDDLDSPPGFTQDNGNSNWLYTTNYAENLSTSKHRAANRHPGHARPGRQFQRPRTGQRLRGRQNLYLFRLGPERRATRPGRRRRRLHLRWQRPLHPHGRAQSAPTSRPRLPIA